jgi:Restriction endonuclease/NACHT domain
MSDRSGKPFEERVADVYRALDYKVTFNVDLGGNQTDLLAEKQIPGASGVVLAVECKDHSRAIGNGPINAFVNRIVAQTRAGIVTGGVVVSRKGFTAKAQAVADAHNDIALLSLSELTAQIFDIGLPLRELVEHYEEQEIFQDYLPLKVETQRWSAGAKSSKSQPFDGLMDQVIDFDGQRGIGVVLVLADFGAGKTTLLRNIEYRRAKAHLAGEDPRVPLFVPLRDFRESQDVGVLLQASFREAYYRDLPLGVLWQRIEGGSFHLLLDGFDEMVDRSDSARRLELFHALLPLLRSRSPVLLTSRPSYLVEPGELKSLLAALRDEAESGPAPVAGGPRSKVVAEELRRKLFEKMQEEGGRHGANLMLNPDLVRVVRLKSLDSLQVGEFVARHSADLAEVDASAADLLSFIERTYDLTDLATRPMLLRLILSTVVIGGIDLSDTSTQYGASGLYEMYTHAKLDFDVRKIRGANTGLDVDTRRRLAESLALEMYQAKTLETDFRGHLQKLASSDRPLRAALKRSGLSEEEIATDLAARSFVTVDQEGTCRFIHKSFRGFFVARVLKEQLPDLSPMFDELIEDEVLYFLGGFAPTEKGVGQRLWRAYRSSDPGARVHRRNLLVAFLHTKPNHGRDKIQDVEIVEAEFGRLQFAGTSFTDVAWRDVTVIRLELVKAAWKNVKLEGVRFADTLVEGGELGLSLSGSSLESWVCVDTRASIEGSESTIERWEIEHSSVTCQARNNLVVKELVLSNSRLVLEKCAIDEMTPAAIEKATMSGGQLAILGETAPETLEASDSVILCTSAASLARKWRVRKSILYLARGPVKRKNRKADERPPPSIDRSSVILAPDGATLPLLRTPAGVFGSLSPADEEIPLLKGTSAWGVLEAEDLLNAIKLPKKHPGCSLGHLLLVRRKRYRDLTSGDLSAPRVLAALVTGSDFDPTVPESLKRVDLLRRSARAQYEALKQDDWPVFASLTGGT